MFRSSLPAVAPVLLFVAGPCPGQDLNALRQQLRDDLSQAHFAKSLTGLVLLSDELEIGGAHYRIDDAFDTRLSAVALPFHTTLTPWGDNAQNLYLEGVLGYARASQRSADIYSGTIPALATSVDTDWSTYGGLLGIGSAFEIGEGLTFAPIAHLGAARIENDTDFGGPGGTVTAALADGIAFNWDAVVAIGGGAGRVDWIRPLGDYELTLVGRYDLRWTGTIREDDPAQDFSTRSQLATVRGDIGGPSGMTMFGRALSWGATASYRRFFGGDLYGVEDIVQLGASFEIDMGEEMPVGHGLSWSASAFVGEDLTGWAIGFGVTF